MKKEALEIGAKGQQMKHSYLSPGGIQGSVV